MIEKVRYKHHCAGIGVHKYKNGLVITYTCGHNWQSFKRVDECPKCGQKHINLFGSSELSYTEK